MKTYQEVYAVLERFSRESASLFSDAWERFPDERTSNEIINKTKSTLDFLSRHNESSYQELKESLETILARSKTK